MTFKILTDNGEYEIPEDIVKVLENIINSPMNQPRQSKLATEMKDIANTYQDDIEKGGPGLGMLYGETIYQATKKIREAAETGEFKCFLKAYDLSLGIIVKNLLSDGFHIELWPVKDDELYDYDILVRWDLPRSIIYHGSQRDYKEDIHKEIHEEIIELKQVVDDLGSDLKDEITNYTYDITEKIEILENNLNEHNDQLIEKMEIKVEESKKRYLWDIFFVVIVAQIIFHWILKMRS